MSDCGSGGAVGVLVVAEGNIFMQVSTGKRGSGLTVGLAWIGLRMARIVIFVNPDYFTMINFPKACCRVG
jgi:hypothetical protein